MSFLVELTSNLQLQARIKQINLHVHLFRTYFLRGIVNCHFGLVVVGSTGRKQSEFQIEVIPHLASFMVAGGTYQGL
jgi:hypothetical protein